MGIHFNPANVQTGQINGQIADIADKKLAMARDTKIGDVSADVGFDTVEISSKNKAYISGSEMDMMYRFAGLKGPELDKGSYARSTVYCDNMNKPEVPFLCGNVALALSYFGSIG